MIQHPSPNWNERKAESPLRYIMLHYTGMKTADEALQRLCDPTAEVSAHYLIDEDGATYSLVPEEKRAWHAGAGFWRGECDMNSASIGIELVNPGHEFGYRPFPAAQIESLVALLEEITKRRDLNPRDSLLAHSDWAPARRKDPGELFPWERVASLGFGLWPEPRPEDFIPLSWHHASERLRQIGYDCSLADEDTASLRAAIRAFQRHYDPERILNGGKEILGAETSARIVSVARLLS